jgi:hypothetical protein
MFASPDWVRVEARNPDVEGYENLVENLLKTVVQEMEVFPKLKEAIRYATIMGHAWGKVVWKEEYAYQRRLGRPYNVAVTNPETGLDETKAAIDEDVERVEIYNGPSFDWLRLDRVFPDPTGGNEWFIEEIETNIDALYDAQESSNGDLYDPDQLAALSAFLGGINRDTGEGDSFGSYREGSASGTAHFVDHPREPEATEGIPNYQVSPMRDGVGVRLLQCWGKVPRHLRGKKMIDGERHTLDTWRLCVIAEGQFVLRDVPAPTPDGKPPYFAIKSLPIPGVLYGESILKYVGPLADQQARIANMRIDEIYLGIFQQFMIAQQKVLSDNQNLIAPGGWVQLQLEPGQSVNDVFGIVPRRPVMPDSYTEDQYRQTQQEHVSGATDTMQGVAPQNSATATQIESQQAMGNARHMLQSMWFDQTVKKELLTRSWQWLQMRMTKPKLVRMGGKKYAEINLEDLTIPIDIIVGGGIFEFSKQQRLAMMQQIATLAQSPVFGNIMKPIPILQRLLEEMGWKNPDNFVKTPEEQQADEQRSQVMAILQGVAGEGGEAPGTAPPDIPPGMGGAAMQPLPMQGQTAQMVGGPSL